MINMTNYSSQWTNYAIQFYQPSLLGFFWDIIFISIGVYLILQNEIKDTLQLGTYFFGVWIVFGGILSFASLNGISIIVTCIFVGVFIRKIGIVRGWW